MTDLVVQIFIFIPAGVYTAAVANSYFYLI